MESEHRSIGRRVERLVDALRTAGARRGRLDRRRNRQVAVPDRHHEHELAVPLGPEPLDARQS